MRPRKLLSILLAMVFVVSSFSATVLADEDWKTITTADGLTLSLPSDFNVIWYGMPEDDPVFDEDPDLTYDFVEGGYTQAGIQLQANAMPLDGEEDQLYFAVSFIADAPETVGEDAFFEQFIEDATEFSMDSAGPVDLDENVMGDISYGTIDCNGMTVYKIFCDIRADYTLRCTEYFIVTESGKMHTFIFLLVSTETEGDLPFSETDLAYYDEVTSGLENSFGCSEAAVAIDADAYVSPNGSAAFDSEMTTYMTVSGLTLDVPSEFTVLWDSMSEDDPIFQNVNVTRDEIMDDYKNFGVELQGGYLPEGNVNGQQYTIALVEKDAPEVIDEDTLLNDFRDGVSEWCGGNPSGFDLEECADGLYGYGTIEEGGYTFFHVTYQIDETLHISFRDYYLFTDTGKMYLLEVVFFDGMHSGEPFSEEDLAYLDAAASAIAASASFEGNTISPDLPAFKMIVGGVEADAGDAGDTGSTGSTVTPKEPAKTFFKSFTEFEFPVWIIAIALVLILVLGAKVNKKLDWQEEPFALDTSKCIQGFAAVAIIFHHMTQDLGPAAQPLTFLAEWGVLFVGVFFFFSGYGLYTSLKMKPDYLKGFIKKRFVTILVPFYICNFIYVTAACISGARFEGKEIFYVLSGWTLINTHMWYIVEIAILYIVFYLLYRFIKNHTVATVLMTAFVLGMMWFSLRLAHGADYSCSYWFQGEWWYNSSLLFVVGIIVAKHSDILRKIARKAYWALIPVLGALVWFLGKRTHHLLETVSYWSEEPGGDPAVMDKLLCLSSQLPWILCFVLLLLLVMMKVRFGNPVLKFLGSISLELYLIHNLFLGGLADGSIFKVKSASMYMILTVLMAIGFATIVSGVDKYIVALITGKKKGDLALASESRIHSIDVMRVVMAFLVVAIHWPFDGKAGDVFVTFGKSAVPFFLVVCGYFLYREDNAEMMKRLIKQTKRMFVFYVLANVFYAGLFALMSQKMDGSLAEFKACFQKKPLMDFLLYNFSPFSEHLWYLGCLLYALIILIVLNKFKVLKYAMFASPALIAVYVILAHRGVEFYQLRNAIFIGLGYTMSGMLIRRFEKKILGIKYLWAILLALFAICSAAGIYEINHYEQGTGVPFIASEILTYVIVLLCLRFPNFGAGTFAEKFGRECSLPIYIMHMAVLWLFVMTDNTKFFGNYGAVAIFVVTALISGAYVSIKKAVVPSVPKSQEVSEPVTSEV